MFVLRTFKYILYLLYRLYSEVIYKKVFSFILSASPEGVNSLILPLVIN